MDRMIAMIFDHFWTKVVSVLVAILLWIVVFSSRSIEVTKEVPLEILTSKEVIPASDLPDKVVFRLAGPKAFLRAILDRSDQPIRINLQGARPGPIRYSFSAGDIRVPIGVRVLNINPSVLSIQLDAVKYSTVGVKLDIRGLPPEGYRIVRSEAHPAQVRIRGARSQISSLTEVVTQPIDVSSIRQHAEIPVTFDLGHLGVQLEDNPPIAVIDVEATNPNFRIRNVGIKVIGNAKHTLAQSSVTIFVRATEEELKNLDHNRIYAEIDIRNRGKGEYMAPVRVIAPKDLGVVKVVPDKVNVTLY